MAIKGIDVSHWQGKISWNKVNPEIKMVIIRAGYGRTSAQKDKFFDYNYIGAKNKGLKTGCYWYSYAVSKTDAEKEADACYSVIKGKNFDFPVYYDIEEFSQLNKGKSFVNEIFYAFANRMKKHGYDTGLYMSRSPLTDLVCEDIRKNYSIWIAEYNGKQKPNYNGNYDIWQYTSNGKVNGINGNVDLNLCYNTSFENSKPVTVKPPKKPKYEVGKTYTTQVELNVRSGAGLNKKLVGYSGLTQDGKKHDKDKDGALDVGTKVTCLEVKTVNKNTWIRIPSGWVCAVYNGEVYIK